MRRTNENLIHEYYAISTIKDSNPQEFAERSAQLQKELEFNTNSTKELLVHQWEELAKVAHNVSQAGLMYIRKNSDWRRDLLEYCTVGPYIWAEGGHVYYAYITADIIQGPSRERLKRRSLFTKDWIPTSITPLKNSINRLRTQLS